jgi:hypothetical protein
MLNAAALGFVILSRRSAAKDLNRAIPAGAVAVQILRRPPALRACGSLWMTNRAPQFTEHSTSNIQHSTCEVGGRA